MSSCSHSAAPDLSIDRTLTNRAGLLRRTRRIANPHEFESGHAAGSAVVLACSFAGAVRCRDFLVTSIASPPTFPDGVLAYRFKNGGTAMPAWKTVLTDRDIWA
jgi:hypothetical protein